MHDQQQHVFVIAGAQAMRTQQRRLGQIERLLAKFRQQGAELCLVESPRIVPFEYELRATPFAGTPDYVVFLSRT